MWNFPNLALIVALATSPALADPLGLGRPATPLEIAAWNIDVRPDGEGLPPGAGSVSEGEELFTDLCAPCHGDFGEGVGRFPALAGGLDTLTDERPVKTIGSYWPYLSTVYDYIRRAQPFGDPGTLNDPEIYQIIAYVLYLNDLVDDEDFVLSRENFTDITLPNATGFIDDARPEAPGISAQAACMTDCIDTPKVSAAASDLGLDTLSGEK